MVRCSANAPSPSMSLQSLRVHCNWQMLNRATLVHCSRRHVEYVRAVHH